MNQELTNKLYKDFPELFRGRGKSMGESAMCFGFDCRDGWFQIIYDLSAEIMTLAEQAGIEAPEMVQVKEKFGGLRYYVDGGNGAIFSCIQKAGDESMDVCEICGNAGKIRQGGWVQTLCDDHYEDATMG